MLHGRVVRPRGQAAYGAGARPLSVDAQSIAHIPGARLLRRGDFLGVVAPQEWDAVRAAAQLRVTWESTATLPGSVALHEAHACRHDRGARGAGARRRRRRVSGRRAGRDTEMPRALPGTRTVCAELRAGRRARRQRAGHLLEPGHLQRTPRHRAAAVARARTGPRAVQRRRRHLRTQLLRRCRAGGGAAVAAVRGARAAAVHALGRTRAGTPTVRRTSARCARPRAPTAS